MVDATFATTGIKAWSSSLKEFGIFPFGFSSGKSDECEAYVGAEMEIDYIVIGSYDYVTAYQSTLEKASS